MSILTENTKPPIAQATLMMTKIENKYKILRLVIRVTLETLEGLLLHVE